MNFPCMNLCLDMIIDFSLVTGMCGKLDDSKKLFKATVSLCLCCCVQTYLESFAFIHMCVLVSVVDVFRIQSIHQRQVSGANALPIQPHIGPTVRTNS